VAVRTKAGNPVAVVTDLHKPPESLDIALFQQVDAQTRTVALGDPIKYDAADEILAGIGMRRPQAIEALRFFARQALATCRRVMWAGRRRSMS